MIKKTGCPAINALFFRLDELPVFAGDLRPALRAASQVPECLLYETVVPGFGLFAIAGRKGALRGDLRVLVKDLVLDGAHRGTSIAL